MEEKCEKWRRAFQAPSTVAHITLIPPFIWEKDLHALITLLTNTAESVNPFFIRGKGIGNFGKRTLFVNVELDPNLDALQAGLAASLSAEGIPSERRRYKPHITLATRLDRRRFSAYKEKLSTFHPEYCFQCSKISLFQFKGHKWQELEQILLGGA